MGKGFPGKLWNDSVAQWPAQDATFRGVTSLPPERDGFEQPCSDSVESLEGFRFQPTI